MKLKNKTNMFQNIRNGEQVFVARPWRVINVPEGIGYDKSKFEEIKEEIKVEKKENKKGDY